MREFAERYHDFSTGHRVYNHESKCAHLHGHNYRIFFKVSAPRLDSIGRVIDFSVINTLLCEWLEENWDHKMLIWEKDPWAKPLAEIDPTVVIVPFNPTAENMGGYLIKVVGPKQLRGTPATLDLVRVEETRKCAAIVEREDSDHLDIGV